jgi:hypothetical protein
VASSARKKRPARVLFAALPFIVLYFLLFPYPLGRELVALPRWAVSIALPASSASGHQEQPSWQFRLGDHFGYVHSDGSVRYAGKALYGVSLSASGFVNYTRLGTDWILQDCSGRPLISFSGSGNPLLGPEGSRIFNVKSDLSGLIEFDRSGVPLWERDFASLVTTISLRGDSLVVGLLNGSLLLINSMGYPIFENSPAGSRIAVILGSAVAPDGSLIAAVSGIDPQFLTVFRRQNSSFVPLGRLNLSSDYRREVRIGFSPDSLYLFLEGRLGAGLYEPAKQLLRWVSLRGRLAGAAFPGHGRLVALASKEGGRAQLAIEPLEGHRVSSEEFLAQDLFVGEIDGQLLLGVDDQLLRIDFEAK